MKTYELTVILHPDLEIDLGDAIKRLESLITGVEATIEARDNWGKQKLAYPIKGQAHGIYLFYQLRVAPATLKDLDAQLSLNEEVMRHLIVDLTADLRKTVAETKAAADNKAKAVSSVRQK